MDLPTIEKQTARTMWRSLSWQTRLEIAAGIFFAVILLSGLTLSFIGDRIHNYGYNKARSEDESNIQMEHDAAQQAIGRAKAVEDRVVELQNKLTASDAKVQEAAKDSAEAKAETKAKAKVYYSIRNKPVRVRPKGEAVSDDELIRDAKEAGLVIR
jgi:23S rRNA maturation mini-RNase III